MNNEYAKLRDTRRETQMAKALERLDWFMRPETRFDDALTQWDRDFLRVNRLKP